MVNILVIDIGTTSMKGLVYDEKACLKAVHKVPCSPQVLNSIEVEQNPLSWKNALYEIVREIAGKGTEISAITLTAQRSSVIPIDAEGNPLSNAIMWQDRRTEGVCASLRTYESEIYNKTGLLIKPIYGAPKITWFKKHMPELYKKADKFVVIADYVLMLLTGKLYTDYTYGNRMLLMDLNKCEWDKDLLEIFEVDKGKLSELVKQGSLIGYTTKELADETGIKQGIPVYSSGGDQQCAALGLGVIENGSAEITHGTGSFLMVHSDSSVIDRYKKFSCNVSAIPGKYFIEASFLTTGAAYDWFHKNFYDMVADKDYEQINNEVIMSGIGAGGVVMLPHFQGTGSPDWNVLAKGLFFNLSLNSKRGDMARALLEGIAVEISRSLNYIESNHGEINKLSLSGGLTSLDEFNQIQADIYNKNLVKTSNSEATSLGAWLSAAVSMGLYKSYTESYSVIESNSTKMTFQPQEDYVSQYEKLITKSEKLYEILKNSDIYSEFAK